MAATRSTELDLLEVVRRHPGLGVRELATASGHATATVSLAVRGMQANGLLRAEQDGRKKRLYAVRDSIPHRVPDHLAGLVVLLGARGVLTASDALAAMPGTPEITVRHRLKQLVNHGLANVELNGRRLTYHARGLQGGA